MQNKIHIFLAVTTIMVLALSACTPAATPTTKAEATEIATAAPAEVTVEPSEAPSEATEAPTVVETEEGMLPEVDPAAVSGNIIAAGSSTVYPLAERMGERFSEEGFGGQITIDSIGSGAGFERFCTSGETDIANASRAIKDAEVQSCAAIGRTPLQFRVGTDAIAFVVSSENTFLTDVTMEELAKIFSSDAVKWSDINPAYPNEDILRFSPGTDSGTFDYFVEVVLRPVYGQDNSADKNAILNAANVQFSEDDNVLVQGVEGSPYAIGYFGYAYFAENAGNLKAIAVEGVTPNKTTAEDGSYKLARPLFIYSDAKIMQEKPQVAAFINFFLTYVNEEIKPVGYFPASDDALDAARQIWLDAMK